MKSRGKTEQFRIPRLFMAGIHGSSGKTTITTGLAAAFTASGKVVQPFKKGPDFIDPLWLGAATGRACRNLDFFMNEGGILPSFTKHSRGADLSIIEGNKGLFDGVDLEGKDSGSAMARLLGAPVILVVDATKMTRGIAPLLQGYLGFEKNLHIAGVILNRVSGPRHEGKLVAAVEHYTSLKVLGAMPRNPAFSIGERHLGLETAGEKDPGGELIHVLADRVKEHLDMEQLWEIATGADPLETSVSPDDGIVTNQAGVRIAVAKDEAFCFYYPENLEALERAGARLVFFSPLHDRLVPEADGLYLGGGFPEVFHEKLTNNVSMLESIRNFADSEKAVYAECGGLMVLSGAIDLGDRVAPMCGALPFRVEMTERPQGRGYMVLETRKLNPEQSNDWEIPEGREIRAHEFHYSRVSGSLPGDSIFGYRVKRGTGITGEFDGFIYKNTFASYVHLNAGGADWWASAFVKAAQKNKKKEKV